MRAENNFIQRVSTINKVLQKSKALAKYYWVSEWFCNLIKRCDHTFQSSSSLMMMRFILNPVYPKGGTMVFIVGKILDFRLSESPKNEISRSYCSPKLFLESWMLHFLCKNLPQYARDVIIGISVIAKSKVHT